MPFYQYLCLSCHDTFSAVVPVALRRDVVCAKCQVPGEIQIQPTMVRPDIQEEFLSPATGRPIRSRRQLQEDLKASGCHLREPGESRDTARRRQEIARAEEAKIEALVVETAKNLGV